MKKHNFHLEPMPKEAVPAGAHASFLVRSLGDTYGVVHLRNNGLEVWRFQKLLAHHLTLNAVFQTLIKAENKSPRR